LSGGLDSSSIVCIAAKKLKLQNKLIYTVSSVLEPSSGPEYKDETLYIRSVLDQELNIIPDFIYNQLLGR
ncbi:MAG TPA: asparagine synthase-related protein, partial [Alphaproteobacteria bacterium]|nr:asparagine synthase-related protein [Alphaproteobacteria bacterium]